MYFSLHYITFSLTKFLSLYRNVSVWMNQGVSVKDLTTFDWNRSMFAMLLSDAVLQSSTLYVQFILIFIYLNPNLLFLSHK